MSQKAFELLAPGGDINAIKAAILAGADAIYCGLDKFNARNRAANISLNDLNGVIHLAHKHNCKVFLTLNILVLQAEIPHFISTLNHLVNTNIDGVIVQDLGVFYLLSTYFPTLNVHASTQINTHNSGQLRFLKKLNARRVNLARELDIHSIKFLTKLAHDMAMDTEVFIHGSYCISFSGLCYISSVLHGRSGNRGRCSQHCRDRFPATLAGKQYPLNLKDNSAFFDVKDLAGAGVDALKIEGRIKECDYVYTVVRCWRKQLENYHDPNLSPPSIEDLYKVFNRNFSNGYLKGTIGKDMFIDCSRDHSIDHLSDIFPHATDQEKTVYENRLREEKKNLLAEVKAKISEMSIASVPMQISIAGSAGSPLTVSVTTKEKTFYICSETNLVASGSSFIGMPVNHTELARRLDFLNHTEYVIETLNTDSLDPGLVLPFKDFTVLKNKIFSLFNNSKQRVHPVEGIRPEEQTPSPKTPLLSVLISSPDDLALCRDSNARCYALLPNELNHSLDKWLDFFSDNPRVMPWFPSVLMGDNYDAAVKLLLSIRPQCMVTNNTGMAYEAFKHDITWIAGPYLNTVNAFSLVCLSETFKASGAFISNEISKKQLRGIQAPHGFSVCYSIFHPIMLLSSRQCLVHQVTGCEKSITDDACLKHCSRSAVLGHDQHGRLLIHKTKGNYSCIYHPAHYLNTDVITDFPNLFNEFLIDLRDIQTDTTFTNGKAEIIRCFEHLLAGKPDSCHELKTLVYPTTSMQYQRGI